jgi:hypothetical protein
MFGAALRQHETAGARQNECAVNLHNERPLSNLDAKLTRKSKSNATKRSEEQQSHHKI